MAPVPFGEGADTWESQVHVAGREGLPSKQASLA